MQMGTLPSPPSLMLLCVLAGVPLQFPSVSGCYSLSLGSYFLYLSIFFLFSMGQLVQKERVKFSFW